MNTITQYSNISNYSGFYIRLVEGLPVPGFVDFPASPEAPKIQPLGNNVKSRAIQSVFSESERSLMVERYRLLGLSKRILSGVVRPGHNIMGCQRVPVVSTVGLTQWQDQDPAIKDSHKSGFHFSGVATCKSVWVCPVCSHSLSGARASEVRQGIHKVMQDGGEVYMLTLTFQHSRFDNLSELLYRCKDALGKMWRQCSIRDFMAGNFIGRITGQEFTYSDSAGWHPHQHILLLGHKKNGFECSFLQSFFSGYWLNALVNSGLSGISDIACDVQPASEVHNYLTKMSGEVALGNTGIKSGRAGHFSPFQLLAECRKREDYKRLWREFYSVTRGKRALVWSRGLKALLGVSERSDEQILDSSEAAGYIPVLGVDSQDWRNKLSDDDLGFIRRASLDEVIGLLDSRGARFTMATKNISNIK